MNEERKIETEEVEAVNPPPRARVPESVARKRDYLAGFLAGEAPEEPKGLQVGEIVIDSERHEVQIHGQPVELTATEFNLLRLLMERRGRVQTREHLLLNVWNYETEIETRTVDTHVRRLREKLGTEADWIETIRGVGYRMAEKRAQETGGSRG